MKQFIGVTAVVVLIAAFSAPISVSASPVTNPTCAEQTTFTQPNSRPYFMKWKGTARRIMVKGSVAATVTGACRGFLSGSVTIVVRSPNGFRFRDSRKYENLEFKNGYNDTGQRFMFSRTLTYRKPIPAGTCVTVTVRWDAWRFNTNELVPNGPTQNIRNSGCYTQK